MSSSPCSTSVRSPRRSETSVIFQLVGPPCVLVKWTLAHRRHEGAQWDIALHGMTHWAGPSTFSSQHEPDRRAVGRLHAPAVGQPADEVEPESAGRVERTGPWVR